MTNAISPLHVLIVGLAGWLNREQQRVLEYLKEENRVLRQQLGTKRLRLTDEQRRRLAARGKALGRKLLAEVATLVSPDTILGWHRRLIARKWDYSNRRRPGRPRVMEEIRELVIRMAKENPRWGYSSIQGRLKNLGHCVGRSTVAKILKEAGLDSAPERMKQTPWKPFLESHWDQMAAMDFFTVEVWSFRGLVTYYLLFVMELCSRRVEIAGITPFPGEEFMSQVGRNLTDELDGFLRRKRFVIMDRDGKYSDAFRSVLKDAGVDTVRLPPRSPNLNAHAERFVRSIKEECLERMIFFGERTLRRAVREYLAYYHGERNHQGLGNRLIDPRQEVDNVGGGVVCRKRLGGLLRFYYRNAA